MKHQPYFAGFLSGYLAHIAYGARTLNQGSFDSSTPLLPSDVLIACAAGFMNVPKIKKTHDAVKARMLAASAMFDVVSSMPVGKEVAEDAPAADKSAYMAFKRSQVHAELEEARNLRPSFATALAIWGEVPYSGLNSLLLDAACPGCSGTPLAMSRAVCEYVDEAEGERNEDGREGKACDQR
jgi:electron-transferring-flavoprotein dehydrogenase